MTKKYITIGLEPDTYEQLEYLSRQIGKSTSAAARMSVDFMLLFLRNSALKAYYNDKSKFDNKAAEIFQKMYGVDIEDANGTNKEK
jgi:hypothetical protein